MEGDEELEGQLEELQAQETAAAAGMHARAERERARGTAIAHQRTIWDNLLSLRMLLQRSLQVHQTSHLKGCTTDVLEISDLI